MKTTFHDFGWGKKTLTQTTPTGFFKKILALPAYHWLMLAMLTMALPHMGGIPVWLLGLLIISVVMQKPSVKVTMARLTGGRLKRSYQLVQVLLFIMGTVAIWVSFGRAFGVDVAVNFLVLCFVAKAWELYEKRDAYVALNLALFTLASAFLIRQDLSVAVLGLPALIMVLMGFVILSDDDNKDGGGRLRALTMITVPAVPLLVVLFLFFPRLPPMWSLPMAGKSATTGVSDSMSPGDFSNLSQSTELAFRAEFDGTPPNRYDMYWRGLVFSDFDGVTWRQSEFSPEFWSSRDGATPPKWAVSAYGGTEHTYRVILEPTEQNWLFALDYPRLHPERGIGLTGDFTLRNYYPVSTQKRYRASYYSQPKVNIELTELQRRINLRLPDGNEESRAFAQNLYAQTGNPIAYVQAVQKFITTGGFSYTLSPPLLRGDRIDEFLFGTKAGFCEHYASSFTFLMRSVGIPARVVAGYQGGELGRDGQSWEVRQMDAHAWSEIWLDGQGWVRVDPTAFVSPDRVEQGMNAVTDMGGASMFGEGVVGQWSYQQFKMLQALRRYSDQMGYYWQKNVVGYDQDEQRNSLFKWFNIDSFAKQFWLLIGSVLVLVVGFVGVMAYRRRRRYHVLDLPLVKLSNHLSKQDKTLAKGASEPYLAYLDRLKDKHNSDDIETLKSLYRKHRYGQNPANKAVIDDIKELVGRIKG